MLGSRRRSRRLALLESLESRTLLSVTVAANGKSATWTDVDGDLVTAKTTLGTFTQGLFLMGASGLGEYMQGLDLTGVGFAGASLTFTAKKLGGGNGLVDIGYIDATGNDLASLTVAGDLGRIDVGDDVGDLAIKSITARSTGTLGFDNQPLGTFVIVSNIDGGISQLNINGEWKESYFLVEGSAGNVTVKGSMYGGGLLAEGDVGNVNIAGDMHAGLGTQSGYISSDGKIAGIKIGGSLIGGTGDDSGYIVALGDIGAVKIGGSIYGGLGQHSGSVQSTGGKIGAVSVGGSVIGGDGEFSGAIDADGDLGAVSIARDLRGGSNDSSGRIHATGDCPSISIGGSLIGGVNPTVDIFSAGQIAIDGTCTNIKIAHDLLGGSFQACGSIETSKTSQLTIGGSFIGGSGEIAGQITIFDLGNLKIGGDFVGGSAIGTTSIFRSGDIFAINLKSMTVGGSMRAGLDESAGTVSFCGSIRVQEVLGSLSVKGSILGSVGLGGDIVPFMIVAGSVAVPGSASIKSINVSGRLEHANILAGYNFILGDANPVSGDAQIGTVKIGGDCIASSIVAGAKNAASDDVDFGDGNDASIGPGSASIIASIASITVGGLVYGTPAAFSSTDHFGFVAQKIDSVKIGGVSITLDPATDTDNLAIGPTGDFRIHEI